MRGSRTAQNFPSRLQITFRRSMPPKRDKTNSLKRFAFSLYIGIHNQNCHPPLPISPKQKGEKQYLWIFKWNKKNDKKAEAENQGKKADRRENLQRESLELNLILPRSSRISQTNRKRRIEDEPCHRNVLAMRAYAKISVQLCKVWLILNVEARSTIYR